MGNQKAVRETKIAVLGNSIVDWLLKCEEPIVLDEKYQAVEQKLVPGGQAATPADLLMKLGNKVFFVGAIGNNEKAEIVKKDFDESGVNYSYSPICDARHQEAVIVVGSDGKRTIVFPPRDKNLTCAEAPLEWIRDEKIDIIYIDGHEPELETRAAKVGHELGIPVVSDLEDLTKPHDFLDYVDVLIAPAEIILQLADFPNPAEATRDDIALATKKVAETGFSAVVATMGEKGCVGVCGKTKVDLTGFEVEVMDTTGAGDSFHAAFANAMGKGYDFQYCMGSANYIAAIKCQFVGGRMPKEVVNTLAPPNAATPFEPKIWRRPRRSAMGQNCAPKVPEI